MKNLLVSSLIMTFMITSCGGTFSYKRGARPEALSVAKADCNTKNNNEKSVNECLEQQGWSVYEFDDLDLFATASETTTENGGRFISVPSKEPSPSDKNKQTEAKATVAQTADNGDSKIDVKSKPKENITPFTTYKVSSWWKWGGGQQQLEADLNTCEEMLGEEHKPNFSQQLVTRGFVICMAKKGWKALKAK